MRTQQKVVIKVKIHEKIRILREEKQWSQEEFAAKLGLSVNGYRKIERGETRLNIPRLQQLADVFEMDILELMQNDNTMFYQINNESDNCVNVSFDHSQILQAKIDKLELINAHQAELLVQKERELEALREIVRMKQKN